MTPAEQKVIHAALKWMGTAQARRDQLGPNLAEVDARLLEAVEMLQSAPTLMRDAKSFEMRWVMRTWNDVRRGDRVRLGGMEAVVLTAACRTWHAHVSSRWSEERQRWYDDLTPYVHGDVCVRLDYPGGDPKELLTMKPSGEVEIEMTEAEIEFFDRNGWNTRLYLQSDAAN